MKKENEGLGGDGSSKIRMNESTQHAGHLSEFGGYFTWFLSYLLLE